MHGGVGAGGDEAGAGGDAALAAVVGEGCELLLVARPDSRGVHVEEVAGFEIFEAEAVVEAATDESWGSRNRSCTRPHPSSSMN